VKRPQIFISYSWKDQDIANKIYHDLSMVGFEVIKDNHTLKYTQDISDFMTKISVADYAVVVISESYLTSANCMIEMLQLKNTNELWKKILPIVDEQLSLSSLTERARFIDYWQQRTADIKRALKDINPENIPDSIKEMRIHEEITQNIDNFITKLKNILYCSPKELFDKFYRPIFDKIGVEPDFEKIIELIPISSTTNPRIRLKKLIQFDKKYGVQHSYYFSILASSFRDLKEYKLAVENYKKAIALDAFNFTAWNNLGRVYEHSYANFAEAIKCYERAIALNPNFDVPRLNLGVLLSDRLKNYGAAKKQYEAILHFDECNAKAHNNIANIYRHGKFLNLDKAEQHLIIAVNQNHFDAIMNYANFLKVSRRKIEEGNKYYRLAKKLNKDSEMDKVLDALISSEKG
jgi:tetratricopeptide (TPR) repeat protein